MHIYENSLTNTIIGDRGRSIRREVVHCPNQENMLPEEIRKYTTEFVILDPDNPDMYMKQGGGHHGSHPHLVHEFVSSIIENREPIIDGYTAANWTAAGICAHESAMNGGMEIIIPNRLEPETFEITKLWDDETGEEIDSVSPGVKGQKVLMKLPIKCEEGWILRRKK